MRKGLLPMHGAAIRWKSQRPGTAFWIALCALSALAFASFAYHLGADSNWDLANYHLYAPYAALNNRIGLDHHPAGLQSYLNPTLHMLWTLPLLVHGSPALMSAATAALHGLNLVLLTAIGLTFFKESRQPLVWALLTASVGMGGALVVSEVGNSMGDLTTAVLVLGAVLCSLRAGTAQEANAHARWLAAAGLCIGLATGLKLTNAVFLVGLFTAVVLAGRRGHRLHGVTSQETDSVAVGVTRRQRSG